MNKARTTPQSIDEYIGTFPPDVQTPLQQVRAAIQQSAPAALEAIKYQLPTFVLHGNLVHFGAFTHHIGFYALPSATAKFQAELASYRRGKGSIQFPLDRPIPLSLIRKIVKFRLQENLARLTANRKKPKR